MGNDHLAGTANVAGPPEILATYATRHRATARAGSNGGRARRSSYWTLLSASAIRSACWRATSANHPCRVGMGDLHARDLVCATMQEFRMRSGSFRDR